MSTRIWAVSSGDYSSYCVHWLCPTEEMANEVVERLNKGRASYQLYYVEEHELLEDSDEPQIRPYHWVSIYEKPWPGHEDMGLERINTQLHFIATGPHMPNQIDLSPEFTPTDEAVQRHNATWRPAHVTVKGHDETWCWKTAREVLAKHIAERDGL